jgi:hypothetical protein
MGRGRRGNGGNEVSGAWEEKGKRVGMKNRKEMIRKREGVKMKGYREGKKEEG